MRQDGTAPEVSACSLPDIMKAAFFLGLLGVLSASAVEIQWVTVGDPGNLPDKTGYGGVPYAYPRSLG